MNDNNYSKPLDIQVPEPMDSLETVDSSAPVSSYASIPSPSAYATQSNLEVHDFGQQSNVSVQETIHSPFSRRKAFIVSIIITGLVMVLTGASALLLGKNAPKDSNQSNLNIPVQDIGLEDQTKAVLPNELQGSKEAFLVTTDIITRGELKFSNNSFVTVLKPSLLTSNQTFTLPDVSGTLCLDSNNCGFASQTEVGQVNAQIASLTQQLGQIVIPNVPPSTLVNNQSGLVTIQGTVNQISVSTNGSTITLSTAQDLASTSSPTFSSQLLTGNLTVNGTINTGLNCTTFLNGGSLTTNASGQLICADDETSGGGTSVTTSGGTTGVIPVFSAADQIDDSIISQALGTITITGSSIITGSLSANSLSLTTALSTANGGTGATTIIGARTNLGAAASGANNDITSLSGLTTALSVGQGGTGAINFLANSLIIGNGSGALNSTNAAANGQLLLGNGTTPTFTAISGDIAITGLGVTTIQANSVALGVDTTGNYLADINTGNGLTVSGSGSEGATPTVSLNLQANKGLEVDANGLSLVDCGLDQILKYNGANQWVCASDTDTTGSFSLSADAGVAETVSNGDTITITGGNNIVTSVGATDTVTVGTVNNPNFTTSITTPLLQSSGALSITPGGALTVGSTSQTALLQGSTTTISSSAGNNIVLTRGAGGNIQLTGFDCTGNANGGVLTTDVSGNISCADDNGDSANGITGSGNSSRLALFTGSNTIADSWLLQNGSTLELDNSRNLSLTGGNFSVTGTGTFSGLLTANGSLTIEAGDTLTFNGDAFTDLTGTGLQLSSGSLQTTLGTSVDLTSEVTGVLPVTNGGTGINGSLAANGTLLIGNGTGYTLATLTAGTGIAINNSAGGIEVVNGFGASIESAEITDLTITNDDIANGTISLSSKTTGNYVATIGGSSQIDVTGSGSNNAAVTLGIVADSIGDGQLAFNTGQNLTTASSPSFAGLTLSGSLAVQGASATIGTAAQTGSLILHDGTGETTTITSADQAGNRTFTIPTAGSNADFCLSTGNCAGAGGGVTTAGGNTNRIALFNGAQTIADSWLLQNGSTMQLDNTRNLELIGGNLALTSGNLTVTGNQSTSGSVTFSALANGFLEVNGSGLVSVGSIDLGGDTNGNYVATITNGNGISGSSASEGGTPTIALGPLTANWVQSGAFDVVYDNAGAELRILESVGGSFYGTFDVGDLSSDETYTFLQGGTVVTNGNISSFATTSVTAGAGLTGGGTTGALSLDIGAGNGITVNANDIAVVYGSSANTAVQGNTSLTVTAGTNLSGGGSVTLGAGGSVTLNVANSPTFSGTVTVQGSSVSIGTASSTTGSLDLYNASSAFAGSIRVATLGQATIYTLPDPGAGAASICLSTGNCAGSGGGVTTAGGTNNRLAKFTGTQTIGDSTLSDNGTDVTTTVDLIVQGGAVNIGTALQDGALTLYGNGFTAAISATLTGNQTFGLPDGSGEFCIKEVGNCSGAGGGNAPNSAQYLTLALDAGLTAERTLSFNGTNFSVVDNGANNSYTVNTAQNINTAATPSFAGLTLTGNLNLNSNTLQGATAVIDFTNFDVSSAGAVAAGTYNGQTISSSASLTGTLAVASLTTLNGGLTIETGDTLTFNGDAFTDLTGNGLQVSTNVLTLMVQTNKGLEVDGNGLSLIDCASGEVLKYNGSNQWACATDGTGTDGDSISVNGTSADDANFVDTAASGTAAAVTWTLNNVSNPDAVSVTVGVASATEAGVITTGAQTFAGVKTFGGQIVANAGIDLSTQTVMGTTATIDFTNFDVSSGGAVTAVGINAGTGLIQGTGGATVGGIFTLSSLANGFLEVNGSGVVSIGAIDLGSDTNGNYVATISNGNGITGSSASEGGSATIALGPLTANWDQTGAFDILLNNANSELSILESNGATYFGTIDVGDLSSDQTFTFIQGGTVVTSGNVGSFATTEVTAGNGLTGGGTVGALTVDIASGNGGIVVNANDITLTLQANKGLDVDANGLSLIDCADTQILKYNGSNQWVCANDTDTDTDTTYTAGNDLDLNAGVFDIESQLDFVSVINQTSASLTLQTTTSGNIVLNSAGTIELQDNTNVAGNLNVTGTFIADSLASVGSNSALTPNHTAFRVAHTFGTGGTGTDCSFVCRGVESLLDLNNPSGAIARNGAAFYAQNSVSNAAYNGLYGMYIAPTSASSASISANYGIYVDGQTAGTNDYGIYVAGADTYSLLIGSGVSRFDGDLVTGSATQNLFNTSATTVNAFGAATNINVGAAGANITGGGALTVRSGGTNTALVLQSNGTGAVTVDSGTSGAVNIGTGAVAKTVTIGNTTGASAVTINSGTGAINIGTTAQSRSVNIGNGAASQVVTLGSTNTTSSVLIQSGSGDVAIQSQDDINIGTNAVAQDIAIGNSTGATSVAVLCGTGSCGFGNNATAHTTLLGSSTGAATTTINAGTGGLNLGNNGIANTITIGNTSGAVNQTINIGTNATASTVTDINLGGQPTGAGSNVNINANNTNFNGGTVNMFQANGGTLNVGATFFYAANINLGSTVGASATVIRSGTGDVAIQSQDDINIGTNAIAQDITIGNTTGATSVSIQAGSGGVNVATGAFTLGTASVQGNFLLHDGDGETVTITIDDIAANSTIKIPDTAGVADTLCLLTLANCAGSATTLQSAYGNDVDGSDAVIALTAADDSIVIRNPALSGSDSAYPLTIDQLNAGAFGGLFINSLGTGFALRVDDSSGDTTPFVIDSAGAVGIGTASPQSFLHVVGNGDVLRLQGTDHAYVEFYPDGGGGREAYLGFGSNGTDNFQLINESATGVLELGTNAGVDFTIDASGNIVATGTLAVQGASLTVGAAALQGSFVLHDGDGETVTITIDDIAANSTIKIPDTAGVADTICLLTLGNCSGTATTLQASYDADINGSDAVIGLSSADGAVIIRDNATPLGTTLFAVQNSAGSTNYLNVSSTGITVAGTISVPGGSTSERFGANTSATGGASLAIGNSATANADRAVAVGETSSAAIDAVAVGRSSSASQASVSIGSASSAGNYNVAIGSGTTANGGSGSIAIGLSASASHSSSISLGAYATSTAANQFIVGSGNNAVNQGYFGNGVTNATPTNFMLQGTGSSTAGTAGATFTLSGGAGASATTGSAGGSLTMLGGNAGGSGNNNGGDVLIQGGVATGTGTSGSVVVKSNTTNSTNAFEIQNAAGSSLLTADTLNNTLTVTDLLPDVSGVLGGNNSAMTIDSTGVVGHHTSTALGSDGFARISYYDSTNDVVKFIQCTNADCSTRNTTTIGSTDSFNINGYTSMQIGSDGFARISYYDVNYDLVFVRCTNADCSTLVSTTVDSTGSVGEFSSLVLGSDGFARISYFDATNQDLKFIQCTNADCSTRNTTTLDSTNSVGQYGSITMGADGFARIAYHYTTNQDLKFIQCTNADCSTRNTTTLDTIGFVGYGTSIKVASDGFARISYYDDSNDTLRYVQCTNADCSTRNLTTFGAASGAFHTYRTSLALDTNNFAKIAFYNFTADDLMLIECENAECTNYVETLVDGTGDVGSNASMAIATDDSVRISYYDATNSDLKFAVFSGNPAAVGTAIGSDSNPFGQITSAGLATGTLQVATSVNTTTALDVTDASGTSVFTVDTVNTQIKLGGDLMPGESSPNTTTRLDWVNRVGYNNSMKLNSSGNAVIAYDDYDNDNLKLIVCSNVTCTTRTTTVIDNSGTVEGFDDNISLILSTNNLARISYYDGINQDLKFIQCTNSACTSRTSTTIDSTGDVGQYSGIGLGSDGFARISYYDNTNDDLKFIQCTNADCSTRNTTTLDATGIVGEYTDLVMGADDFARIAYFDNTNDDLKFIQCTNADCSTRNTNTVTATSYPGNISMALGLDGFARIVIYDGNTDETKFIQCTNADCSTSNVNVVGIGGYELSITLGTDGFTRIAYRDTSGPVYGLKLATCTNASCSTYTTTVLHGTSSGGSSMAFGSDGFLRVSYADFSYDDLMFMVVKGAAVDSINLGSATNTFGNIHVTNGNFANLGIGTSANDLYRITTADSLFNVDLSGNVLAKVSSTTTSGTATAVAGVNTTTINLTSAGSFVNNDIIFINNAGQDYYTRIVSGAGTTTLTVSPAVSYDASATITRYVTQNIGTRSGSYTGATDRYFQGYFLSGIVAGASTGTTYSDGIISASGTTGLTLKNSVDSTTALRIQNASGSVTLLTADVTNSVIKVGTTASATLTGADLLVGDAEVTTSLRIGTNTDGVSYNDGVANKLRLRGTARNDIAVYLSPEFEGLTVNADGTNNVGTLNAGFCSGSSVLSVNTTVCGANDEHNFYEWSTAEASAQDYDMYIRYKLPADFDGFVDDSTIKLFARTTDTTDSTVILSIFRGATQCGSNTTINSSNNTWQETSLTGNETGCSFAAGDIMTIKIKVTAGSSDTVRVGAFSFVYKSSF